MTAPPDDVGAAIDRVAGEVVTSRQSFTDQAVVVLAEVREALVRLDGLGRDLADVQDRQGEALAGIARLVAQHDRMIARLEALAGLSEGGGEPRLAAELRRVLDEESRRFGETLRDHAAQGERVLGAGMTSVAARLGEALAELREEMAKELDAWLSDLPTETRLRVLADRLDDLAERIAAIEALLREAQGAPAAASTQADADAGAEPAADPDQAGGQDAEG